MNSFKPLLIVAVLAGIGYGVYNRLNKGPTAPPPGAPEAWGIAPQVQMGDSLSAGPSRWTPPTAQIPGAVTPSFAVPPAVNVNGAVNVPSQAAPPFGQPSAAVGVATPVPTGVGIGASQPNYQGVPGPPEAPRYGAANSYTSTDAPPAGTSAQVPLTQPQVAAGPQLDYAAGPSVSQANSVVSAAAAQGSTFAQAVEEARRQLDSGQLADAHRRLSEWYGDPRLSAMEQQQLNELLDQVAGTVVYSTQHSVEPPYEVQPGERLEQIGEHYSVPWQLLAKINGIDDPQGLRPGERLKVVRGPFTAVVSLEKRQMTLMLNGAYAGRFAIGVGRDQPPREGTYVVSQKLPDPVYHGPDRTIEARDPSNPLGERLIKLGEELSIHGTNDPAGLTRADQPGCISLSPHDVEDVYDILTVGSTVQIRR